MCTYQGLIIFVNQSKMFPDLILNFRVHINGHNASPHTYFTVSNFSYYNVHISEAFYFCELSKMIRDLLLNFRVDINGHNDCPYKYLTVSIFMVIMVLMVIMFIIVILSVPQPLPLSFICIRSRFSSSPINTHIAQFCNNEQTVSYNV